MKSHHFITRDINWASPILLLTSAALALVTIQKQCWDKLQSWGYGMSRKTIEVDEDLPPFFRALKLTQSEELCAESHNMLQNYGFEHTDPDTIEELRRTSIPEKSV